MQGDGLFGLFSGKGSRFLAAACAITMKTQIETVIAEAAPKRRFPLIGSSGQALAYTVANFWCVNWGSGERA